MANSPVLPADFSFHISEDIVRYRADFAALNRDWISRYFTLEAEDLRMLEHPEKEILAPGGRIFFLLQPDGAAAGTAALIAAGPRRLELAKMAVREDCRGRGLGRMLLRHAVAEAKAMQAHTVDILSAACLGPAIHLYQSEGFIVTHRGPHPRYARCDIGLKLDLTEGENAESAPGLIASVC